MTKYFIFSRQTEKIKMWEYFLSKFKFFSFFLNLVRVLSSFVCRLLKEFIGFSPVFSGFKRAFVQLCWEGGTCEVNCAELYSTQRIQKGGTLQGVRDTQVSPSLESAKVLVSKALNCHFFHIIKSYDDECKNPTTSHCELYKQGQAKKV